MYSGIFEQYHQGGNFEKTVYIDLLDDIIFSYGNLKKAFKETEDGLNNLRRIYKSTTKEIKNINGDIKGIITYKKVNNFNDKLREQMILKDENELIQIRAFRFRFIKVLLLSGLINESKEGNENKNQSFFDDFDELGPGLKYFTKLNSKGEISISFDKIKEENGVITIGKKTFYIQDPKNLVIFLGITILKGVVEHYGVPGFNKYLRAWHNGDIEEEDIELILIHFSIIEIEKIRKELLESDSKELIKNFNFRGGNLYINGDKFQFNKKAPKASIILSFLSEYFETYKGKSLITEEDLKIFFKENIKRYSSLAERDLEIENLRTGFKRTFDGNILKKYKFNCILGITKEHLVLIGKD